MPYYIVTDPETGKKARRSKLTKVQQKELQKKGYEIKRKLPETGKHKFVYPLGKKQKDRDKLTSYIVKQLYSYPDEENPSGEPIQNEPKQQRLNRKKDKADDDRSDRVSSMDAVLNTRITNPETDNQILVKTALGYEKNHPAYRQAVQVIKQYQKSL